ncbi:uracil-DNA glycosylase family protein [candidate division KSB1 bacterium]
MTEEKTGSDFTTVVGQFRDYLKTQADLGLESVVLPRWGSIKLASPKQRLAALNREVADCLLCPLGNTRTNLVFGVGDPAADLLFIGEAPGRDEDLQGFPFVGRAGQLLTKILKAMGLEREQVYIANILKCRPPGNREPLPTEVAHCLPILKKQVDIIRPKIICALGRVAAQNLLGSKLALGSMRGGTHEYNGVPVIVTYHPAAILRNPAYKRPTWDDMQVVMRFLGLEA